MFFQAAVADALGGLIAAVVVELYKRSQGQSITLRRIFVTLVVASLVVAATDLTPMPVGQTIRVWLFPNSLPDNERWTINAWQALERGDYLAAINSAEQVIDLFGGSAERQQKQLEEAGEPLPSIGRVAPWTASTIFRRGVLNDVASSYWIAGRAYEALDKECEAKAAYTAVSELTYARTWDPQWWPLRGWSPFGWFWSPAEVAQDRISGMSCP